MSSRSEPPASKGMMMIAAYRAERLRQRPILRSSLRDSHEARRNERESGIRPEAPDAVREPTPPRDDLHDLGSQPMVSGSVFARYSNLVAEEAAPERIAPNDEAQTSICEVTVADLGTPPPEPDLPGEAIDEGVDARTTVHVKDNVVLDPPLAEIGFGPGMLIRLSQIGVRTTQELAKSDLGELRAALGDISRLVDVGAWISSAQRKMATGSGPR